MIIGTGQLAKAFKNTTMENTLIFASGVSNSNCEDINEFLREENLLRQYLDKSRSMKFIYFSSSALSAKNYKKNTYYKHKEKMELIIKESSLDYIIFRIPQLFGPLKRHNTLINYIFYSILDDREIEVYTDAYRYVIDITDLKLFVEAFVKNSDCSTTIDIANTYKYKIIDIVNIIEKILNKKSKYKIVKKFDEYDLNLNTMSEFLYNSKLDMNFGKDYLKSKLEERHKALIKNNQ